MNIKTTFIYVLNDPRTNQIRYVGKADDPYRRWNKQHCFDDPHNPHKSRWVAELRKLGLKPELEILEEVPYDQWEEIEREYIRVFRMIGIRLTNIGDGGETGMSGRKHTPETIEKLRESHLGYKMPDSQKRKISEANRGRPKPDGFGERISLAKKGISKSPEHIEKIRLARLGSKDSLETREKKSLSGKLAWEKRKVVACFK